MVSTDLDSPEMELSGLCGCLCSSWNYLFLHSKEDGGISFNIQYPHRQVRTRPDRQSHGVASTSKVHRNVLGSTPTGVRRTDSTK